jgi:hypothetical protein
MTLDLTDDEARALIEHLRHALEYDPFPFAPRLDPLKSVLAKLEPPAPQPELLLPPLKPGMGPSVGRARLDPLKAILAKTGNRRSLSPNRCGRSRPA